MRVYKKWSLLLLSILLAACTAGCAPFSDLRQVPCALGTHWLTNGEYRAAVLAFSVAITIEPNRAGAYVGRGDAYAALASDSTDLDACTQALTDYQQALDLGREDADLYQAMADLYIQSGDTEAAQAILAQGVQNSGDPQLAQSLALLQANAYSDLALIQWAQTAVNEQYNLVYGLQWGAYFSQDWDAPLRDTDGRFWFPVTDSDITTLAGIDALWHTYFSTSVPLPAECTRFYREIDGQLYTCNEGIGGNLSYMGRTITGVLVRDGLSATLTGYETRANWASGQEKRYNVPLTYQVVWENGAWKCCGITLTEPADSAAQAQPAADPSATALFDETYWHWNLSPGNGGNYWALFHADGTFSCIHAVTLEQTEWRYVYDGTYLYLDGVPYFYSIDDGAFFSFDASFAMGAGESGWQFSLSPDPEQRYAQFLAD